jgi:hypothetical protein
VHPRHRRRPRAGAVRRRPRVRRRHAAQDPRYRPPGSASRWAPVEIVGVPPSAPSHVSNVRRRAVRDRFRAGEPFLSCGSSARCCRGRRGLPRQVGVVVMGAGRHPVFSAAHAAGAGARLPRPLPRRLQRRAVPRLNGAFIVACVRSSTRVGLPSRRRRFDEAVLGRDGTCRPDVRQVRVQRVVSPRDAPRERLLRLHGYDPGARKAGLPTTCRCSRGPVLELRCGRGEFLDCCATAGSRRRASTSTRALVQAGGRAAGLTVQLADALTGLPQPAGCPARTASSPRTSSSTSTRTSWRRSSTESARGAPHPAASSSRRRRTPPCLCG